MVLKAPYKGKKQGFTLVELIFVMTIILTLTVFLMVSINPLDRKQNARDTKRLSDIQVLARMVDEFRLDNFKYPDMSGVLRISTTLPAGQQSLGNVSSGWIQQDLSKYNSRLPLDPLNDDQYYYSYFHDDTGYELNAKLENDSEMMQSDGGNDVNSYETGTNLNLISP